MDGQQETLLESGLRLRLNPEEIRLKSSINGKRQFLSEAASLIQERSIMSASKDPKQAIVVSIFLFAAFVFAVAFGWIVGAPSMISAVSVWFGIKALGASTALAFVIAVLIGGSVSAYAVHRLYVLFVTKWVNKVDTQTPSISPDIKDYREGLLYFYPTTALGLLATLWSNPLGSWIASWFFSQHTDLIGAVFTGCLVNGVLVVLALAAAIKMKRIRIKALENRF
ncbi:MAG: hypothetical protein K2Y39_18675 [Candidatus Obscuribacterales bacterium]|nr:hypothetical protein [Candidatus Obscuribacterales bacterium]